MNRKCNRCNQPFDPPHILSIVCQECLSINPNFTIQEKSEINLWDHLEDVLTVYNLMKAKGWTWAKNMDCKYIELRIDMRDGGCIIKNKDGLRISPEQLAWQYSKDEPEGPDKRKKV